MSEGGVRTVAWVVISLVLIIGINAWGTAADEAYLAEEVEREADRAASYEAGRQVGMQDAVAALAPQGLPAGGCALVTPVRGERP